MSGGAADFNCGNYFLKRQVHALELRATPEQQIQSERRILLVESGKIELARCKIHCGFGKLYLKHRYRNGSCTTQCELKSCIFLEDIVLLFRRADSEQFDFPTSRWQQRLNFHA